MNTHSNTLKFQIGILLTLLLSLAPKTGMPVAYGVQDYGNQYPNIAMIGGVKPNGFSSATCSGSLLQNDTDKFVILTAGHCAVAWLDRLSANIINTVGVSFDQDARVNGDPTNRTRFIAGGMPIVNPTYMSKYGAMSAVNDIALVVFPKSAVDPTYNMTLDQRWPGLAPITLPQVGYLESLVANAKKQQPGSGADLVFTVVGYGT